VILSPQKRHVLGAQHGGFILPLVMLFIFGFACFLPDMWLCILWTLLVILIGYFVVRFKRQIVLYEEGFVVHAWFPGKKTDSSLLPYSCVKKVRFAFASVRGEHIMKFYYEVNGKVKVIQAVYAGIIPKDELQYLRQKGVFVEVSPTDYIKFTE
jgi:hypothetical protein